jgi:hypothetical protein
MGQAQTRIWSVDMLRDAQAHAEYRRKHHLDNTRDVAHKISLELVVYILNQQQISPSAHLLAEIQSAINQEKNFRAETQHQNRSHDRRRDQLWIRRHKEGKRLPAKERRVLERRQQLCRELFPEWFIQLFNNFVTTLCQQ